MRILFVLLLLHLNYINIHRRLFHYFLGQIHLLRYEDLSMSPFETVETLLSFLDLPPNLLIDKFITTHTQSNSSEKNVYGTTRDSKNKAFQWKQEMKSSDIKKVQKLCSTSMALLGYNFMDDISVDKNDNQFQIMLRSADQIWKSNFT